jgi:hypothetical protein
VLLKYQEDVGAMRGGGARTMLEESRVGGADSLLHHQNLQPVPPVPVAVHPAEIDAGERSGGVGGR